MGFFENFQNAFEKETQRYEEDHKYSRYKTVKQRETEEAHKFDYMYGLSDSQLLSKYNGWFTDEASLLHL